MKKEKSAKEDTPQQQQRNNYSKTTITLPVTFLREKALVKRISTGQGTVNVKWLGKDKRHCGFFLWQKTGRQFTQTLSSMWGERLHILFEKSSVYRSTSHASAPCVAVYNGFSLEQKNSVIAREEHSTGMKVRNPETQLPTSAPWCRSCGLSSHPWTRVGTQLQNLGANE